jgi:hypothetical protein
MLHHIAECGTFCVTKKVGRNLLSDSCDEHIFL